MSELASLLELLHGAGERWKTARLVVRRWGDGELAGVAMRRHADRRAANGASRGTAFASARSDEVPSVWEMSTRAWIDRSGDRARIETSGDHGERLTIRSGALWWSYSPQTGSVSNETEPEVGGGGSGDFDWMLEPSSLLPALDFTPTMTTEVAGRLALAAVGVPRAGGSAHGPGVHIGYGADDVLLVVDRERGIVLSAESRIDGQRFGLFEVTEVAFDEEFDDGLFQFVSPDGSPVRSPRGVFASPEPVAMEEAARRASFTVLVPTRLPQGWTLDVAYLPPSERPARADSVTVRVLEGTQPRIWIQQAGAPVDDELAWEPLERSGRRILISSHVAPGSTHNAKVELDGTHVRVKGNLDRETFLDIVASLGPAPTELPPMRI